MSHELRGKIAVISGAASGIGLATAQLFARKGARVLGLDIQPLPDIAQGTEIDYPVTGLRADLTQPEQVQFIVKHIIDHFGRIDILVHAAGGSGRKWGDGPAHECTLEGWQKTVDLNLNTAFYLCNAVLKEMMLQKIGVIVNIASVLGLVGGDQDFATHAYAASKGAVISLTRAIASYYAPYHIRANVVCPSLIATPMSERAQQDEGIRQRLTYLQPLTGDFGAAEDVAQAALYLASDAAAFITGAVLTVDGGWTVR